MPRTAGVVLVCQPHFTLIWSSTMLLSGATTKMHVFWVRSELYLTKQLKKQAFFQNQSGKLQLRHDRRWELLECQFSGNVTNTRAVLQPSSTCQWFRLLTVCFVCWQSYFCVGSSRPTHISLALAVRAVSLFFFSGCRPHFSRLTASPLDSLSHARG